MNPKLVWNVYIADVNQNRIDVYNIFQHSSFVEDCKKVIEESNTKDEFGEGIQRCLMYYFWSKCEWEIVLSDFPPYEKFKKEKIDVYDQVMLNWNVFIEYFWNNKDEL